MQNTGLTVGEICEWMDARFAPELQEDWDRVGLICGNRGDPVTRILLAVDPVEPVVDEALEWGAQLVITHHPLFLRGTSFVSTDTAKGRVVHRLIRGEAALFNAHTNADSARDGVAEALAQAAGLDPQTWRPLQPAPADTSLGIGRVGPVTPTTVGEVASRLANLLPSSPAGLLVAGESDRPVKTVAVSGGSGQSLLPAALDAGADVFVTADLRHHPALDFLEMDRAPALIMPSHWASEWMWLPRLETALNLWTGEIGKSLETKISTVISEPWDAYIPTVTEDETEPDDAGCGSIN